MGIKLFTGITDNKIAQREQFAYKVVIEPFEFDSNFDNTLDNFHQLTAIARDRLKQINRGYSQLYDGELIRANEDINWEEASIVADMESEESLAFSYNTTWSESAIGDLVNSFIPSSVTGGLMAKFLTKAGTSVVAANAYNGTFMAANFNGKKLLARPTPLTYNLTIKVIDKDGSGTVLKTLTKLLSYSVPTTTDPEVSVSDAMTAASSAIGKLVDVTTNSALYQNNVQVVLDVLDSVINSLSKIGSNGDTVNNENLKKAEALKTQVKDKGLDDNGVIKSITSFANDVGSTLNAYFNYFTGFTPRFETIGAPCPVRIFVSDYFVHSGCVITSVAPNLSKQININGYPVYGTFNITVEAREMTTLDLGATFSNGPSLQTLRNVMFVTHKTREKFSPHVKREAENANNNAAESSTQSAPRRNGRSTGGKPA